jgi:hypothetical protein
METYQIISTCSDPNYSPYSQPIKMKEDPDLLCKKIKQEIEEEFFTTNQSLEDSLHTQKIV